MVYLNIVRVSIEHRNGSGDARGCSAGLPTVRPVAPGVFTKIDQ
jgi:hypothetical protein